jgi:hypothetical protein
MREIRKNLEPFENMENIIYYDIKSDKINFFCKNCWTYFYSFTLLEFL